MDKFLGIKNDYEEKTISLKYPIIVPRDNISPLDHRLGGADNWLIDNFPSDYSSRFFTYFRHELSYARPFFQILIKKPM